MRLQFLLISFFQLLYAVRISGQCLTDQRSLLLQLKNNLIFNSSSSKKLSNWNPTTDCCIWDGIICDTSGHVTTLNLENELISSGIENSTPLFNLRHLQNLNLASNTFNGIQIPKGLQNLTNLTYLNLSNSGFGGQIPVELSTLTNLVILDLSTLFPGINPLKLENPNLNTILRNLTGLKELYLDSVVISARDNDWCRALSSSLPNLTNLSLRDCDLSGRVESSLLQLKHLSVIHLDNNNLSTTVPDFFANFSNLTILTLSSCSLNGRFPEIVFEVPTLRMLDLSNNKLLSGSLPDSVGNLRMLSKIDLSNCKFDGFIPSTMANLTELVYLDFSANNFTGLIPPFQMSKKLSYIDLSRNSLTGSFSNMHFEGLFNLVYLNLGYNSLNGSVPDSLFRLPSLQRLQLSNNKFSGRVDEFSASNSSNLDTIDLSNNHLEGSIPESFFELERLNVLSLSSNFFNGTAKLEKIRMLRNLTRLEIGYNNLTVDVSSGNISSLPQLSRLNLAYCNLSGFPDLRHQRKITFLDLSNNRIHGEIPKWIWNVGNGTLSHLNLSHNHLVDFQRPFDDDDVSTSLRVLDLHSNGLRGEFPLPPASAIYVDYSNNVFRNTIPPHIGNSTRYAMFFSLANNSLIGKIPESICFSTYLQVLDLSGNNLTGNIPSCFTERITNTLGVLNLAGNNIDGVIPDSFPVNCSLKTLDLSSNNLEGKIPPSLANCEFLEVVNVGSNGIEDTFPCMLRNSTSLRVLVLRHNGFHGDLRCPAINGSWPKLQIIDVAYNNFTGELYPKCIASWTGMALGNDHDHLRYEFLNLNKFYYQDTLTVTIKGLEMELVKILEVFTAIDFSCNGFSGAIPQTVGDLSALYVLNLSHNSFTGNIPNSVGKLKQLGSLDLSANDLTGEIPKELASLNFLSFLNLSYNKLVGRVPTGSQFQTFTNGSFSGNRELCGFPLNTRCDSNAQGEDLVQRLKETGFDLRFILIGLGFGVGASLIVAPLAFCKQWREKWDEKLDGFVKMVFPRYGFSYVRYDNKVEAVENIEDEMSDNDDDDDDEENGDELSSGRYCVFCTKMDFQMKRAVHNPKCTCHYLPPNILSSSFLVVYH